MNEACLYRVDIQRWAAPLNEYDEPSGPGRVEIVLRTYKISRYTTTGAWIILYGNETKFVNLRAVKQYASASVEEAKEGFIARKLRYIKIMEGQIAETENALEQLNKLNPANLRKTISS